MIEIIKNYYRDNQVWVDYILKCFVLALVLGGLASFIYPELLYKILSMFADKFGPEPALNLDFAISIFLQNALACAIALLGGILFGITSVVIVLFNGFIIGFIVIALMSVPGNPLHNLIYLILGLAPHGIFELPAFFLASSLGLRLGIEYLRAKGQKWEILKQNFWRVVYGVPVIAILLAIAALVEVFVSGNFVNNLK